jgi:hypothetical protein
MIGFDGIALISVMSNPEVDAVTGIKNLQMRIITHNDGGSWKQLILPNYDSHGQPYACQSAVRASLRFRRDPVLTIETGFSLRAHGYTNEWTLARRLAVPPSSG